ncbi:MAG: phospholipase D family protein [Deltaproteobacteria bacterium]|nr:phospholipase D family protein [Deltaproteobacteria bacterium]
MSPFHGRPSGLHLAAGIALSVWAAFASPGEAAASVAPPVAQQLQELVRERPGETGVYILDKSREAMLARAWMVNNVRARLDVQTFIWNMDGVGTLATEALLRAAERGARVRVLVDALTRDAPKELLLALARHPKIEIRIYNSPGPEKVPWLELVANFFFDFRRLNQRMHNKKFLVDGLAAITGGRNVADEYFDYSKKYNFHDRDVLLAGAVVRDMEESFAEYWASPLTKPVEELWAGKDRRLSSQEVKGAYLALHRRADDPDVVGPEVREALRNQPEEFRRLLERLVWTDVRFVSDRPRKNVDKPGLGGGGKTERAVKRTLDAARKRIVIQTPYLILSPADLAISDEIFQGVEVSMSTNSLASTDNLASFSAYRKQREHLLKLGVQLREFRPHPALQASLYRARTGDGRGLPILVLHSKTVVVDGELLFVGTFNLDPRSANLNTEEGVVIRNRELASFVEEQIRTDMKPENSWDPRRQKTDQHASLWRRLAVWFLALLPLKPLV